MDKAVAWALFGLILLAAVAIVAFLAAYAINFIAKCAKKLARRN